MGYIPSIKWLIETTCTIEHTTHGGNTSGIPLVQWLIEAIHTLRSALTSLVNFHEFNG